MNSGLGLTVFDRIFISKEQQEAVARSMASHLQYRAMIEQARAVADKALRVGVEENLARQVNAAAVDAHILLQDMDRITRDGFNKLSSAKRGPETFSGLGFAPLLVVSVAVAGLIVSVLGLLAVNQYIKSQAELKGKLAFMQQSVVPMQAAVLQMANAGDPQAKQAVIDIAKSNPFPAASPGTGGSGGLVQSFTAGLGTIGGTVVGVALVGLLIMMAAKGGRK